FEPQQDHLESVDLRTCYFIPLRGLLAAPTAQVPLGPNGAVSLFVSNTTRLAEEQAAAVRAMFSRPSRLWPTGGLTNLEEVREGLHVWLVAHDPRVYTLWAEASLRAVPDLFGVPDRFRGTLCACSEDEAAVLGWTTETAREGELCVYAVDGEAATRFVE